MIPQVTTTLPTSTMKVATVPTAPMSWKDVVKRAPQKGKMPQAKVATKPNTHSTSTTTRVARSRSISRIVPSDASPRPRCESKTNTPKNGGKTPSMTRRPNSAKQVSFKPVPMCKDDGNEVSTHPMADLIDRLGLTGPRLPRDRVSVEERRRGNGRSRSASADEVLLRRAMPLWLMEAQAQSNAMCTAGKKSSNQPRKSRKERAMSVPNAALVAMDCCHKPLEEDSSDCDDTHSESTSDSSCMSPRHVPVTQFVESHDPCLLDIPERSSMATADSFAEYMTPEDEEEDMEALELLDRINSLAAEFKAHREYEESSALAWSVQHAARKGVLSPQLQQSLLTNIRNGSWEEARDVLYHKCHLVPAVASTIDHPNQPPLDPKASASFEEYIEQISPPESAEMKRQKLGVLKTLSDLLTRWVKMIGFERGLSEEHIALTGGSLFLAGSYRLGLHDSESDIDAVCVVPWHVTYEDFFSSFCQMLESTAGVTQLAPVPHAYVPLISLSFEGVSMDLLFARLPMTMVESHQDIDSDHILVGVDPSSMKSLNAPRVSSMLLCLVPRGHVFRIVLRAVRTWARRRGVYSAKLGYLGGISWAILVAFVCQMYPDAEPVKVLVRFFQVFSEWQWPRPVMLNMVYDAGLGFVMWDPRQNLYDSAHIMPIITPAYPHMNSAVQITQSTYSVIFEEFWRARYLADIAAGPLRPICPPITPNMQAAPPQPSIGPDTAVQGHSMTATSSSDAGRWEKLFQQSNFFIRYGTYLVVNFYAASDNSMHAWGKFVQSRLRKLVDSLQHVSSIVRVHAFPCFYPHTNDGQTPGSCMFIGVEFQTRHGLHTQAQVRNDSEVKSNLERTIRFFLATDLQQLAGKQEDMGADATVLDWSELPDYVFPRGRATAEAERAEYYQDIERMMVQQPVQHQMPMRNHTMDKFGVPKWRSGPRGRFPNGKNKQSRGYRDKTGYVVQAG